MDTPQDEVRATLPNLVSVHVLTDKLVTVSHLVDVLTEIAQQIVQEEIESLQEVAIVSDFLDWVSRTHELLNEGTVTSLPTQEVLVWSLQLSVDIQEEL